MKRLREENINTKEAWDANWIKTDPWVLGTTVLTDRLDALAEKIRPSDSVLDVGGARGEIAEYIRTRTGCGITVAEIAPSGVAACLARGVDAVECDFRILSERFGSLRYDVVISGELLEHADDPAELVRQMAAVCRPGGWLSLSTPCSDRWDHDSYHVWRFDPEDIERLLHPYGEIEIILLNNGAAYPSCIVAHCKIAA